MIIRERKGNILKQDDLNVILSGCNTQNVMGAGLAKQIVDLYPQVLEADKAAYDYAKKVGKELLGQYSCAKIGEEKYVVNLYQQSIPTTKMRALDYNAFYDSLSKMANHLSFSALKKNSLNDVIDYSIGKGGIAKVKIGVPVNLGCGLAGGDWNIVRVMIERIFKHAFRGDIRDKRELVFVDLSL